MEYGSNKCPAFLTSVLNFAAFALERTSAPEHIIGCNYIHLSEFSNIYCHKMDDDAEAKLAEVLVVPNTKSQDELELAEIREKNKIPDALLEFEAVQTQTEMEVLLNRVDNNLKQTLSDIDLMINSRLDDFDLTKSPKPFTMPLFHPPKTLIELTRDREEYIKLVTSVKTPDRCPSSSEVIMKEVLSLSDITQTFNPSNITDTLLDFFKECMESLLRKNLLLIARFSRIFTTAADIMKYSPTLQQQIDFLREDYADCAERYERLFVAKSRNASLNMNLKVF